MRGLDKGVTKSWELPALVMLKSFKSRTTDFGKDCVCSKLAAKGINHGNQCALWRHHGGQQGKRGASVTTQGLITRKSIGLTSFRQ